MNNLSLVKTETFGTIPCDFYQGSDDFYMTREQIGRALGYENPRESIKNLHSRHRERLTPFSRGYQIDTSSGKQMVTVYSCRGIMEICRWSQQPKANAFMDWVWDVMDKLITGKATITAAVPPEFLQLTQEMCRLMGEVVKILPDLVQAASANVSVSVTPPAAIPASRSAPRLKMERFPPYVLEYVEDMFDHNAEKGHNRGLNFSAVVRYCESQGCKVGHHSVVAYFKKLYDLDGRDNWRHAMMGRRGVGLWPPPKAGSPARPTISAVSAARWWPG